MKTLQFRLRESSASVLAFALDFSLDWPLAFRLEIAQGVRFFGFAIAYGFVFGIVAPLYQGETPPELCT